MGDSETARPPQITVAKTEGENAGEEIEYGSQIDLPKEKLIEGQEPSAEKSESVI